MSLATMLPEGVDPATSLQLVLKIGYRGTDFCGYAEQPGHRTVAGELRRALETLLRRPVDLACAGRTDAGVHAISQYVSMPITAVEGASNETRLLPALTALTPDDMSVRAAYLASADFSARFDAVARTYRYRLVAGPRPVATWGRVWWLRKNRDLDLEAMQTACSRLIGEHDFASFCKASSSAVLKAEGRSTSRCVKHLSVARAAEGGEDLYLVEITANAFLHNMVRIIVGSLVEVGSGRRSPTWVGEALAAHDRRAAGQTAPPWGLTFEDVTYPQGSLIPWVRYQTGE